MKSRVIAPDTTTKLLITFTRDEVRQALRDFAVAREATLPEGFEYLTINSDPYNNHLSLCTLIIEY